MTKPTEVAALQAAAVAVLLRDAESIGKAARALLADYMDQDGSLGPIALTDAIDDLHSIAIARGIDWSRVLFWVQP